MNKTNIFPYQNLLNHFETVSLDDLDRVRLLDRKDTKFVFNQIDLPHILEKLKPFYRILEINNDRVYTYDTTYFDTDDFQFYVQHHNGSRNRFKVRFRRYSSNKKLFFEINEKFGDELIAILIQSSFVDIELKKDVNDKDRMIKAVWK